MCDAPVQMSGMDQSLNRRSLGMGASILAFLVVFFLAFYPFSISYNEVFWKELLDAGHLLLFGFVALVFYNIFLAVEGMASRRYVSALVVSMLLALLVEEVQPFVGRTASLEDFINGGFGILIALSGLWLWNQQDTRTLKLFYFLVSVLIVVNALRPAWHEWKVISWRDANFPVLADFEDEIELSLWRTQAGGKGEPTRISLTRDNATHANLSLAVHTGGGSWAGIAYRASNLDWHQFSKLSLDVNNPAEPFVLHVRIDDDGDVSKYGMRFEKAYPLSSGLNKIEIGMDEIENGPRRRKLNTRMIDRLILFTGKNEPRRSFYIDNLILS